MSQSDTTSEEFIPFMSFTSLRDSHRALLKRRRQARESADEDSFWAEVTEFLHRGEAAGAFIDNTEDREAAQSLLDYWHNQLFHAGKDTPEAILDDFDATTQPEIPDSRCPYIGLEAFDEHNKHLFYGRDQLVRELLDQVLVSRLVTAVGPSGSGKSSVVLAGLLPRLEDGALPGSEDWHYYPTIVPGVAPLTSLARLLEPDDVETAVWVTENYDTFLNNSEHLAKLINEDTDGPAVLTIDQFEETFTLCHDDQERDAFIDNLLGVVNSREARHVVILTMRVDYESYLNKVPMFKSLYEQGQVRVTAMNASELHDAIEQPAEAIGLKFEDGLIEALVREIVGEPAALPLLQFALLQLWDNRERNRITWDAYRRLGGVMEALDHTADSLYNDLLPEEQNTVRRILLRLVRPGTGVEFTRSRATRRALYQSGEANDRIDRVLEKLVDARLLRQTDGPNKENDQFEVAHEALVRNWPRLVEWLEDERVVLRHRLRFTAQAEDWDTRSRDAGALLRGKQLQEALLFEELNPLEQEYIDASKAAEQSEIEAKQAQQKKELEQAQKLAEEQRQRAEAEAQAARRARSFNIALIVILLLVVGGAFILINAAQLREDAAQAESAAAAAEITARETAVAADRLAIESTTAAFEAATVQAMATSDNALATSEVAANQTLVAERAEVEGQEEATVVAATSTAQKAILDAQAAQATQEAINNTPEPTVPNQPTATRDPALLVFEAHDNASLREQDNMKMLFISGGTFQMGVEDAPGDVDNDPAHLVMVDSFYLDQFEVTVQQYAVFLNQRGGNSCNGVDCAVTGVDTIFTNLLRNLGSFDARPGTERFPATWITWEGAVAYCAYVDARLPTEAEWEYAARGVDDRIYPWGDNAPVLNETAVFNNNPSQSLSVFFPRAFVRVDRLPDGASPFGIIGMAGGAAEWVQDWYDPDFYSQSLPDIGYNDDPASGLKVLRGGSWADPAGEITTTARQTLPPNDSNRNDLTNSHWGAGFRCARDADQ